MKYFLKLIILHIGLYPLIGLFKKYRENIFFSLGFTAAILFLILLACVIYLVAFNMNGIENFINACFSLTAIKYYFILFSIILFQDISERPKF